MATGTSVAQPGSVMKVTRSSSRGKELAGLIVATALALGAAACIETDGPPLSQETKSSSCPKGSVKRSSVQPDIISAFSPCCDGSAHLIPSMLIPADFQSMLEKGPKKGTMDTLCVPDEFATDANYTPKRCKSLFGLDGACLSSCIPQVRDAAVKLPKDICPGNQLCAPCLDPQKNMAATGACNQGAMACDPPPSTSVCKDWEPTGLDVSKYPGCGPKAHCAPANLVDENFRKELATCTGGFCVPDAFLLRGGHYTPPFCRSLNGAEGRCLSTVIPQVADAAKTGVPVSSCDASSGEVCAPCYDPRTGMGTGACTRGCDQGPKEPAKQFEQCGTAGGDALCVPANLVPGDQLKNFDNQGCKASPCTEAGNVCVPKKMVDAGTTFVPKKCNNGLTGFLAFFLKFFGGNMIQAIQAISEYSEGRCISRCLPAVRPQADLLGQDSECDADEVCAPCFDPQKIGQGKVSTGACDRG